LDAQSVQQLFKAIELEFKLEKEGANLNMFSINDNYQDEDPMFSSPPRNKQKPLQQMADDFKFGGFE
jgi:hypothetical protein